MTAILTQRCDPFGYEREKFGQRLAGGMFPDAIVGKYIWHCEEPAIGRYVFRCTGGNYGFRRQADQGLVAAFHCDGGHESPEPMVLCRLHVRECADGPPKPGWSKDKKNSWGQIGGTKANEMCPRCAAPDVAKGYMAEADWLQQELAKLRVMQYAAGLLIPGAQYRRLEQQQNDARQKLDELHERGIIHKCPLILREVS